MMFYIAFSLFIQSTAGSGVQVKPTQKPTLNSAKTRASETKKLLPDVEPIRYSLHGIGEGRRQAFFLKIRREGEKFLRKTYIYTPDPAVINF